MAHGRHIENHFWL